MENELKPIRSEADYERALGEIERRDNGHNGATRSRSSSEQGLISTVTL